ncbi:MAG TPA: hypothetical protein VGQ42_09735 [Candidatus Dormibacteraeota bacterium]|jgi:hypothetical protein|nr:hypothetical protein [Candidatus Dormibacteraeota bacterium]
MRATAQNDAFAAAVLSGTSCPSRDATGALAGVEHEYRVVHDGAVVDFARLIRGLDLGRRHLDPADANAYRLPSGAALTCDERDAEIALPPIAVSPGFTHHAVALACAERADLQCRLGPAMSLRGYSTHISISVDAPLHIVDSAARLYVHTFAVAMMLLLDRRDSYGIYVRPRPGRLELCGEYASGERLRAALAFAVGSVCACVAAVSHRSAALPPRLMLHAEPAAGRYGYMVHRHSAGGDLYATGRDTVLRTCSGDLTTAQHQLGIAWTSARAALPSAIGAGDTDAAALRVHDTTIALPINESPARQPAVKLPAEACRNPDDVEESGSGTARIDATFGRMLGPLQRPTYAMAPVMLTWDAAVMVAARLPHPRFAFVCVPRAAMSPFLYNLDTGALDTHILARLEAPPSGTSLTDHAQTRHPAVYDELGPRRALLAPEPGDGP